MSWVANVMLSISAEEDRELLAAFSKWLEAQAPWREESVPPGAKGVGFLRPITESNGAWGGWKHPEATVWAGVTNHADVAAIVDRFESMPWREPSAAQLFVQDQEQNYFRVWMLRDGIAKQYAPDPDVDNNG